MTEWPVPLRGVTETVVTTQNEDGSWALAALGVHAGDPVTARTWGGTRTRHNFDRTGTGYIQFLQDPVTFVDAALGRASLAEPIHESADAWSRVSVDRIETDRSAGTEWVDWKLTPLETTIVEETVPVINRGHAAVIEASIAASRLDVSEYPTDALTTRLDRYERIIRRCGGDRDREALDRIRELSEWSPE